MRELHVRAVSARNLLDKQTFGRQDPYCKLTLGTQRFTTRVHDNGDRNPVWNEKFVFQVSDVQLGQLHIQIKDKGFASNVLIGECMLPINMFQHGDVVDQWFPLNCRQQRSGEINLRVQLLGDNGGMMKGQPQGYPAAVPYNPQQQQQAYPPPQQAQAYPPPQQDYQRQQAYPPQQQAYPPQQQAYPPQQTPYAQPAPYAQAPPQQYPPPNYPVPQQGYPQAYPQSAAYPAPQQYAQAYPAPPQPVYVQQPTVVAAPPVVFGAAPVVMGAPPVVMGAPGMVVTDHHHHGHRNHHGSGMGAAAVGVGAGVLGGMLLGDALDHIF